MTYFILHIHTYCHTTLNETNWKKISIRKTEERYLSLSFFLTCLKTKNLLNIIALLKKNTLKNKDLSLRILE